MARPLFLLGLLLAACATTGQGPVAVDYTTPEIPPSVLGPDDVVEVRVHLEESLSGEFVLGADGHIDYPLLGRVSLEGRLPSQAAADLQTGLADGYLIDPHVTVTVKEFNSRKISVLGEVARPGRLVYRDGMTVLMAVAEAGGTTESALLSAIQVTRPHEAGKTYAVPYKAITLGRAPDFVLIPGDVVLIQESAVK